ncbi:L-histidine N(alpha)-methyltransferase [Streptomyces sp. VNUA116]|uniref:L-histidine N(alpha)-methyltransferase n=1 Tax=Streptomyces sp. VNUA116 TaxID=3062449 RepID=UPI00267484CE|nr:L-histidine N(alpha)-methyltransferase [Streptomyces sp. VNUA116]WKU43814.1 L-histidine N(alpha)-methyltransferase [Streptomyces sp. VNUA116]
MAERDRAVHRIPEILRDAGWTVCLVGEEQSGKLAQVTAGLRRGPDPSGSGKLITSGFSYWGLESTVAWAHACNDLYYPVMRESIASFSRRWRGLSELLPDGPLHYVSLGPGTGQKDQALLRSLDSRGHCGCYLPVDVSAEMLRLAQREALQHLHVPPADVLPVQLDFSMPANLDRLGTLVRSTVGDDPVVYSLLGNTLANFDSDTQLLTLLAEKLLRPQDRFLLEVASTAGQDEVAARAAAQEYENSPRFREFVTSALLQYTDLQIDMNSLTCEGLVEDDRALLIKVIYRNRTGAELELTLPDRSTVRFPDQDTIRLLLSRKYTRAGLEKMLVDARVTTVGETHEAGHTSFDRPAFGMTLLLLAKGDGVRPDGPNPFD